MLKKFDSRIGKLVPADLLIPRGSKEEKKVAALIRQHYMKDQPVSEETLGNYLDVSFEAIML